MSFLDDIVDVGKGLWDAVTSPGIGSSIARAASLGYMLNQVTSSINKDNQVPTAATTNTPDPGVRLQVDPDTNHSVPVVYGQAWMGGIVTDAKLMNNNQTMYFCLTLCEKTGTIFSTSTASAISVEQVYWDGLRVNFQSDGITVASFTDSEGTSNTDVAGLIKIYCFSGNSTSPISPTGYSNGSLQAAYAVWGGNDGSWTSNHTMNDLVFAIVRIDYSRDKGVTALGDVQFKLKNTLSQPGDVIYDYMTNTRYGAGIPSTEIYSL